MHIKAVIIIIIVGIIWFKVAKYIGYRAKDEERR